ncbi:unnamed protein product [Sphenostylis stenocarpa]|uniref:Uncharacterized protein n=1 Tax=Sphenostylis stenocarpa TaxID=92480 RepID=A0AA86T099_9FABA|nr:unnamed protein product [Sphenostylis stenocarpa]
MNLDSAPPSATTVNRHTWPRQVAPPLNPHHSPNLREPPSFSFIKSTITKPASKPTSLAFLLKTRWVGGDLGCLQSLLPLHSAVPSARLTSSCLGIDK